mmetsp:Transcript_15200/g.46398  ORF Transcript_15200/g.46398 Transcript_15200/m.46398 type:complete len:242 (-) Transcript_15200:638-1363(-)
MPTSVAAAGALCGKLCHGMPPVAGEALPMARCTRDDLDQHSECTRRNVRSAPPVVSKCAEALKARRHANRMAMATVALRRRARCPDACDGVLGRTQAHGTKPALAARQKKSIHDSCMRLGGKRLLPALSSDHRGTRGSERSFMWGSSLRSLDPLALLHGPHAVTVFCHVVLPPSLRGCTWSYVSSLVRKDSPQYWHWKLSRMNRLRRVRAGTSLLLECEYFFSTSTDGSCISSVGLRTLRS